MRGLSKKRLIFNIYDLECIKIWWEDNSLINSRKWIDSDGWDSIICFNLDLYSARSSLLSARTWCISLFLLLSILLSLVSGNLKFSFTYICSSKSQFNKKMKQLGVYIVLHAFLLYKFIYIDCHIYHSLVFVEYQIILHLQFKK